MLNPRRVLTRAQLLDHVWDYDFGGDARVLETYISYLRKKLDAHGPPLIHTVRGVGYALRPPRHVMRVAARAADRRRCSRSAAVGLLAARRRSPTPSSARSCSTASTSRRAARCRVVERALERAGSGVAARRRGERRRRPRPRGGAPAPGLPPAPTASCATPTGQRARHDVARVRPERHRRRPSCPRPCRSGESFTVGAQTATSALPRARASRRARRRHRRSSRSRCARSTQTLDRLLLVEALVIAGVLLAARRASPGASCASACGRSTAWATRPARSPAATSRTASSRPTRAPRSGGSGWR